MRLAGMAAVLATLAVVAACGRGTPPAASPDARAHAALCAAADAAGGGDAGRAAAIFADRAHEQLHDLAARVEDVDRGVAARLLERKQQVEAAIAGSEEAGVLRSELHGLATSTRAAITAAGGDSPTACT